MPPRLRVLAGTSLSRLVPITELVNTPWTFDLSSDVFKGQIVVNIKGMTEKNGRIRNSEYFERDDRRGITWSIQVQGRFLEPLSADDILFGNVFDQPFNLPWGTGAAIKFMHLIDPTLEHDLASKKPWALSPLISTMPHFAHKRLGNDHADAEEPSFPPIESLEDSVEELHLAVIDDSYSSGSSGASTPSSSSSSLVSVSSKRSKSSALSTTRRNVSGLSRSRSTRSVMGTQIFRLRGAPERRAFFSKEKNRKAVVFGPEDLITIDFCYGFINFTPTLSLQLPGGLSFDLMKYWDRQPVQFVCCKRKAKNATNEEPWGRILWCIAIELVE